MVKQTKIKNPPKYKPPIGGLKLKPLGGVLMRILPSLWFLSPKQVEERIKKIDSAEKFEKFLNDLEEIVEELKRRLLSVNPKDLALGELKAGVFSALMGNFALLDSPQEFEPELCINFPSLNWKEISPNLIEKAIALAKQLEELEEAFSKKLEKIGLSHHLEQLSRDYLKARKALEEIGINPNSNKDEPLLN